MQKLEIRRLTGTLGAEVVDFDLKGIGQEDFDQVALALWQHQVLVFRKQQILMY